MFKATFTKESPESRGALSELMSALIGEKLAVISITANEPPVSALGEKQIRYDIACSSRTGGGRTSR